MRSVRFTADEYADIRRAAAERHLTPASFIASAALSAARPDVPAHRLDVRDRLDELHAVRVQLSRVGTNLNQIAKILNAGAQPAQADLDNVLAAVRHAVARTDEAAEDLHHDR
ncbi:plasmid mobilization protein [Mangrovactinospora gilvigrisea]|uniref:plasmid mobilization protein n=1 Tax=Mangrovactinospora gilvigrisea TaxID=1428644 RepID=UPI000B0581AC|nr:plasmid mobilization relaxosome protein MobC [Mangrovactinospora gilvigrisea]